MSLLMFGIMGVCAIGMFIGMAKQKQGATWGQPLAIACIIAGIGVAVFQMMGKGGAEDPTSNETAYRKVAARKVGAYLAEKYPGKKAIVILLPSSEDKIKQREREAYSTGLKEGFGDGITLVAEISPDLPEDSGATGGMGGGTGLPGDEADKNALPPLEFWFTAPVFDKLIKDNAGKADIFITTLGLPMQARRMKFWSMKPAKRPLLAMTSGTIYELKKAIKGKAVVAAVAVHPDAVYDDKAPPKDTDEAFDKRFLLVTPDNVDQLAGQYELFAPANN